MTARRLIPLVILVFCFTAVLPGAAQDQVTHVILPGETLFRISEEYGVSVEAIARANDIANTWRIYSGQTLIIPSSDADISTDVSADVSASQIDVLSDSTQPVETAPDTSTQATTDSAPAETTTDSTTASSANVQYHTVAWGESLGSIATHYNMSIEHLAELNHITNPDLIYSGQRLVVEPGSASAGLPGASDSFLGSSWSSVTHVVQPGETLVSIAERYNISWLQIAQANSITDADMIMPGVELQIPGADILPGADYSFPTAPAAPAPRVGVGREVIVVLSEQRVYAYEDGKLVRSVIVSTGLPGSPTVQGSYKVQRKYVAQTMTGPGYYLPDVPYVMYFYAGYALHGTYWHNNFGHPMSHGCVNLPTPEAEWFYNWTDIGTPVYVMA